MKELSNNQTKQLYAGGLSAAAWAAIVSGVSFVIGIFDGITRTLRCN
jgi:hypothetical protein